MKDRVTQIDIKHGISVKDLTDQMFQTGAFNGGRMGFACQIYREMIQDNAVTKFLSVSGALISAGLQKTLLQIVENSMVDAIISTGAILTHDLLEDLGEHHLRLEPGVDDQELRKRGINRIFDVAATDSGFERMEKYLLNLMEREFASQPDRPVPTHEFLRVLGSGMSSGSFLGAAVRKGIPVFCPAITDSMLGVHVLSFAETTGFKLDPVGELKKIISLAFDAKKTGALVLGGGVPKNYAFQACLVSGKTLDYAIQITMDRPEHGGLSGASLDEAISWGKISTKGKMVTVVADVTIALPILVASVI
ncbi:MAG: deoxyhypusine synthase family protein [Candidatus Odinarchaeota archaeon]